MEDLLSPLLYNPTQPEMDTAIDHLTPGAGRGGEGEEGAASQSGRCFQWKQCEKMSEWSAELVRAENPVKWLFRSCVNPPRRQKGNHAT